MIKDSGEKNDPFPKWKFKHPYPEDLKASFESQLNLNFDNLFNLLKKKAGFNSRALAQAQIIHQ